MVQSDLCWAEGDLFGQIRACRQSTRLQLWDLPTARALGAFSSDHCCVVTTRHLRVPTWPLPPQDLSSGYMLGFRVDGGRSRCIPDIRGVTAHSTRMLGPRELFSRAFWTLLGPLEGLLCPSL